MLAGLLTDQVGEGSWYCWMNRDESYNNCSVPEKKAKLSKEMKYVYSLLPLGEVVMAKLPGYPLWPGLLTPDPTCGEYYDALLEKEHEPMQYHVEFLGEQHSRAWLRPNAVHPYNSVSEEEKAIPLRNRSAAKLQAFYQSSLDEARRILPLTTKRRLQVSNHFKFKGIKDDGKVKNNKSSDRCSSPILTKSICENSASYDERIIQAVAKTKPDINPRHHKMKKQRTQSEADKIHTSDPDEEFMSTVTAVMRQRGLPLPKTPMWRGQQVRLHDLFKAVQSRGGFESVCKDNKWNEIYSHLVSSGTPMGRTIRLFYLRHLLPYEMFIKGPPSPVAENVVVNSSHTIRNERDDNSCITQNDREDDCLSGSEGEQKVPEVRQTRQPIHRLITEDVQSQICPSTTIAGSPPGGLVPSSNPDTPLAQTATLFSDDNDDDDDDIGLESEAAEHELLQLERLLSSLEPSLYPPPVIESPERKRYEAPTSSTVLQVKTDVFKTLDEMAKIEGAIAELDTMVSLELNNL
ncbi:uncharacterized protein LOC116619918 [Nematostella vectensis]|uniref:uncharacterized protein LOC116619918 n=1 Tax=Nematostella vectensis TaxID=45351 RepID=UPI0020775BB3|nr:uncharacterized protein LOC116619918 [Nematostella vectensis]XP_048580119.1 uncharacterized protein LOC116619918 [Nematostella vectensis]